MADAPTLSGIELKAETIQKVAKVTTAMKRGGLEPPPHVTMMLEVIGQESEKRQAEYDQQTNIFSPQLIRMTPFTAGTDFEFHIYPESAEDKAKAEQELDTIALRRIKETFK